MSTVSAPIPWPPDILSRGRRTHAKKGTYAVIRIQEGADPLPTVAFWRVRVRVPEQSRTHATQVFSREIPPFDAEAKLRHELASYVHLPDDWDGEGASAPSQAAVDDALTFLDGRPDDIPLPHPDQGSEGAVGIYWDNHDARVLAEATFDGDGTFAYFAAHGVPGASADKCGSDYADVAAPWPQDMLRILRKPDLA